MWGWRWAAIVGVTLLRLLQVEAMTFRQYYGLKLRPRKVILLAECGAYDDSDWSPYGDNQ
jgi:hypothetical protein